MKPEGPKHGVFPRVCNQKLKIMDNLNSSWMHGVYPEINAEINVNIPYVSIGEFYAQGEDAEIIINEITKIYNTTALNVELSIKKWSDLYL